MQKTNRVTTRVSTKGQVILPKSLRDSLDWNAGTELLVEETKDGILLRRPPALEATRYDDVFSMLKYEGAPKTIEEMDQGVLEEAGRRFARD